MCELRGYLYTCSAWLNDESDASDENITGNNEPTHDEKRQTLTMPTSAILIAMTLVLQVLLCHWVTQTMPKFMR